MNAVSAKSASAKIANAKIKIVSARTKTVAAKIKTANVRNKTVSAKSKNVLAKINSAARKKTVVAKKNAVTTARCRDRFSRIARALAPARSALSRTARSRNRIVPDPYVPATAARFAPATIPVTATTSI